MIRIRISAPTLGDFLNGFAVYEALARTHGRIELVLPSAMRMFNGIRPFVEFQGFASVFFEDETDARGHCLHPCTDSSRTRSPTRPFETCAVENDIKTGLGLDFAVDDSYCLKLQDGLAPGLDLAGDHLDGDHRWAGDRWNKVLDHRRACQTLVRKFTTLRYLDFNLPLMVNLKIIAQSRYPFVSTFTGVSILADLINKPNIVLWGEDMRNFAGHPPAFSFDKHYYADRHSVLMHIDDFKPETLQRLA